MVVGYLLKSSRGGGANSLFRADIGMCGTKGMAFDPFWSEFGYRF